MPAWSFAYHEGLPVVELDFALVPTVGLTRRRLAVDSGFTGRSAFVLQPSDVVPLSQGLGPEGMVSGALAGRQRRMWVTYSLPTLATEKTALAMISPLDSLDLPPGVDGLAGLTFLQEFAEWGGRRDNAGNWSFVLATQSLG
jgi:hypothetical protein